MICAPGTKAQAMADIPAFNQKMIEEIAEGRHGKVFSSGAKQGAGIAGAKR
jgi:hypothetical protein